MSRKKAEKIETVHEDQLELEAENMPAASPIAKAAKKYIRICDEIAQVTDELNVKKGEAKKVVLDLMKEEGKRAVIVDGAQFTAVHKDAVDELRVIRKKNSKKIENDED